MTKLLWVDCETSGLDPNEHVMLELACVVTDEKGNVLEEHASLSRWSEHIKWDPFCLDMHTKNGLIDDMKKQADHAWPNAWGLMDRLVGASQRGEFRWAGRGCHFDIGFVKAGRYVSNHFWELLSHRVVDVASIEFFEGVRCGTDSTQKTKPHRALPDLRECISHYRYLLGDYALSRGTP